MNPRQIISEAGMTTRQQHVVALWAFDGLSTLQIAKLLGITHQTVQQHLTVGLAKLQARGLRVRRRKPEQLKGGPVDPETLGTHTA